MLRSATVIALVFAGAALVDVLGGGSLHFDDAADTLLLVARDVQQRVAFLDG